MATVKREFCKVKCGGRDCYSFFAFESFDSLSLEESEDLESELEFTMIWPSGPMVMFFGIPLGRSILRISDGMRLGVADGPRMGIGGMSPPGNIGGMPSIPGKPIGMPLG